MTDAPDDPVTEAALQYLRSREWSSEYQTEANFDRIVACLNACRGIPTEELANWSKTMNECKLPYASIACCKSLLEASGYSVAQAGTYTNPTDGPGADWPVDCSLGKIER